MMKKIDKFYHFFIFINIKICPCAQLFLVSTYSPKFSFINNILSEPLDSDSFMNDNLRTDIIYIKT